MHDEVVFAWRDRHPALVDVVGRNGRIAYVLTGHPDAIVAAVRAL